MDEAYKTTRAYKSAMAALESAIIDRYTINIPTNIEKEGGMCA